MIAKRLAAIEAWHREHGLQFREAPPDLPHWEPLDPSRTSMALQDLVRQQGHVLRTANGWIVCGRCMRRRRPHLWKL